MLTKINVLFASFTLQFTASMLGFKVQLGPPTVNICGKAKWPANSEIGYYSLNVRKSLQIITSLEIYANLQ